MKNYLCIYHGGCADGFTSAWIVRKALGDQVEFVPGDYNKPPPDVKGRDVIMVDFSYKAPVIRDMAIVANSILILDHHKTARAELEEFISENPSRDWSNRINGRTDRVVACAFDMDRAGAGMTWDFFFEGQPRPDIVTHAEDRDLWHFNHPETRAIHAYMMSHEHTFENWDKVAREIEDPEVRKMAVFAGEAIDRNHLLVVKDFVAENTTTMIIGGHEVPAVNVPWHMASDAAGMLAKNAPFGVAYYDGLFDGQPGRKLSLRVRGDSEVDVSKIAVSYGGGGHAAAASFNMELGWPGEDVAAHSATPAGR